jgi:two-component system NtrC family sensor kinase
MPSAPTVDVEVALAAASRVFLRSGIAAVSVQALADELGVEVAQLPDELSEDYLLLRAMIVAAVGAPADACVRAVAEAPSGEGAISGFLRALFSHYDRHPELARVLFSMTDRHGATRARMGTEVVVKHLQPINERMFGALAARLADEWGEGELPQGIHPRRLAFVAWQAVMGILWVRAMSTLSNEPTLHTPDDMIDELGRALASPTTVMRQLSALNDVARELALIRDEAQLRARAAGFLRDSLHVDSAILVWAQPDGSLSLAGLALREGHEPPELVELIHDDAMPVPPHYRRAFDADRTVVAENPHDDPQWPACEPAMKRWFDVLHPSAPLAATPVRVQGKAVGVVAGHLATHGRKLDRRDVSRLETFASMVGLAIENARFYADLNAQVETRTRELRDTQAMLVQSEKLAALGFFNDTATTEIYTPVGAMGSVQDSIGRAVDKLDKRLATLLSAEQRDDKVVRGSLRVIRESAELVRDGSARVTGIVDRLRRFAQLDQAEMQRVALHLGVEDAVELVRHLAGDSVTIESELAELPPVLCAPGRLNQVFLNLLTNAIEAMPDGGTLRVTTASHDDSVEVVVSDTGVGIDAAVRERLFDPGFTTKGVGVGIGLGLAVAYQVVQHHCGRIEVQSEPGAGSTFRVVLPRR